MMSSWYSHLLSFFARNDLNQLKDAYTKLFEDYNELQEENKKREVQIPIYFRKPPAYIYL